jgi:hypothetical protein
MGNQVSNLCSCGENENITEKPETSKPKVVTFKENLNNSDPDIDNIKVAKTSNITTTLNNIKKPKITTFLYPDGSKYIGEVNDDNIKNGKGRLVYSTGDGNFFYEGEFLDGFKSGVGKENYPDNSYYEGEFLKGKKHGHGKFFLSNGSQYFGEFNEDKIQGKGKFIWIEDEKEYEGSWINNSLSGFGIFKKNGKIFKGYFYNDKKHGYGVDYLNAEKPEESFMLGTWVENEMQGVFLYFQNNVEQIWKLNKNKVKKIISDLEEIKEIKKTEEYLNLMNFYKKMIIKLGDKK